MLVAGTIAGTALGTLAWLPGVPRPGLGLYILLGLAGLVAGFVAIFVITCLCERQYLSGDVEPASEPFPYRPIPYWQATREAAIRLGWQHGGDFATRKNTSKVRGLLSLFTNQDRLVLAAIYGGSAFGTRLKKTILRTRLATGRVLESADNPGIEDFSGVIERAILLNAALPELSAFHAQRIRQSGAVAVPFNPAAALQEYEKMELEKGARWVLQGMARWVDPQQTSIRMTLRGACAQAKRMAQQTNKLTRQQHRTHIRRAGSR